MELVAQSTERTTAATDALLALAAIVLLAWLRHRAPPSFARAIWLSALAVSLTAGAVQAADLGTIRVVWDFDHNGVFHLVQLVGIVLLGTGLRRILRQPPLEAA